MKGVGKKIREIRMKNKDTLEQLGKKLNFNYSNLSKIEREIRTPSIELIEEIARLYDVPLSYFFGEEQEIPKELKEIGVEWITVAEELKEKMTAEEAKTIAALTPDEIKAVINLVSQMKKL